MLPDAKRLLHLSLLVLALTGTVVSGLAATHLFVAGHGLTLRTTGKDQPNSTNFIPKSEQAQAMINECKAMIDGEWKVMPWMKFIELEYDWNSLENDLPNNVNKDHPGKTQRSWNQAGLDQIRKDAILCAKNGMYLRVMLLQKYANFPAYMTEVNRHAIQVKDNTPQDGKPPPWTLKLHQSAPNGRNTLQLLKDLYSMVIENLQRIDPNAPEDTDFAKEGFYGFVIQETAFGTTSYYDGDDEWTAQQNQAAADRKAKWYENLRNFHVWLGGPGRLLDFDNVPPRGRLFWQMINSPYQEVLNVVSNPNLPDGAGFCGPDTFPRESSSFTKPSNSNEQPMPIESSLYKTYDQFMRKNRARPISLHVYSGNYTTDRAPFLDDRLAGVQPIWSNADSFASNGSNNKNAGDGISNFLGCVINGNKPDDLEVHNIVWSWIDGTLIPFNGEADDPDTKEKIELADNEASEGQPTGVWGWKQVKDWMLNRGSIYGPGGLKNSSGQFPQNNSGGCRAAVPTLIAN